jgi:polyisoprenoid-binding protein YceI
LKTTSILAGVARAALATASVAQPPAGGPPGGGRPPGGAPPALVVEKDPTKIRPGGYVIEPEHTRVMFGLSHKGFTTFYGEFRQLTGTLDIDPKNPAAAKFDIKVPVTTISTQIEKLNEELRHKPWLDADTYPTIEFKSTSVKQTSPTEADVTGDFSFHGQTHPLTLHVKFNAAGDDPQDKYYVAGFTVSGAFKRSAWGWGFAAPMIGDDVQLIIQAAWKIPH